MCLKVYITLLDLKGFVCVKVFSFEKKAFGGESK